MSVEIKERQVGPVTILELSGRLALGEGSTALNEKLQSLIGEGRVNMLLECSRVTALDSQGISALVRGIISTQKRGGKLKLLRAAPRGDTDSWRSGPIHPGGFRCDSSFRRCPLRPTRRRHTSGPRGSGASDT